MRISEPKCASTLASAVLLVLTGCGGSNMVSMPSTGQPDQSQWIKHYASKCPCLYVRTLGPEAIQVYPLSSGKNRPPTQDITGPATQLSGYWVAVDANNNIYASNINNNSVTIYAAGSTGNVAPTALIGMGSNREAAGIIRIGWAD